MQPSVEHDADPVGDRQRLLLVVGDQQRRLVGRAQDRADLVAQRDPQRRVERAERFVEQQQGRGRGERPRERHPLALAPAQLRRSAVAEPRQAHEPEHLGDAGRAGRTVEVAQPERDVRGDVEVGEQRMLLEHQADAAVLRWQRAGGSVDRPAGQLDRAGVGSLEAGDDAQQRRLPAARRAEQGGQRAVRDVEVDAVERDDRSEAAGHAAAPQGGRGGGPAHGRWRVGMSG